MDVSVELVGPAPKLAHGTGGGFVLPSPVRLFMLLGLRVASILPGFDTKEH